MKLKPEVKDAIEQCERAISVLNNVVEGGITPNKQSRRNALGLLISAETAIDAAIEELKEG